MLRHSLQAGGKLWGLLLQLGTAVGRRLGRPTLPVPLLFALIVGGSAGALTGAALLFEGQSLQVTAERDLQALADQATVVASARLAAHRPDLLAGDLEVLRASRPGIVGLAVVGPADQLLAGTPIPSRANPNWMAVRREVAPGTHLEAARQRPGIDALGGLAATLGVADILLLALATVVASGLARHTQRPLRQLNEEVGRLTRERFDGEAPPQLPDRDAQSTLEQIWALGRNLTVGERDLAAQNTAWQRRYGQARGLIDLMAEFNQAMGLHAVLERLTNGLSRFFAGDGVAIWIRDTQHGHLELAAQVNGTYPHQLDDQTDWTRSVLDGNTGAVKGAGLPEGMPSIATPLLDPRGLAIGIVVLTSGVRAHYTAEEHAFLTTVIAHAALAVQNATVYEYTDALSRVDALTGLHNRREFDRVLTEEFERATRYRQPLSLLMIDIDHFKRVNDERGHPAGDEALKQVAELVYLTRLRSTDAAFRFGGEEFVLLLTQTDRAGALLLAERLRVVTEGTRFFSDGATLTVSVGVASYPGDAETSAELVSRADGALYEAKRGGRNRVEAAA
jgi:diguanylate cyclase (GGDEF)-like protein